MNQEEQKHRLGQTGHFHFLIRIIGKKDASLFVNANTTHGSGSEITKAGLILQNRMQ